MKPLTILLAAFVAGNGVVPAQAGPLEKPFPVGYFQKAPPPLTPFPFSRLCKLSKKPDGAERQFPSGKAVRPSGAAEDQLPACPPDCQEPLAKVADINGKPAGLDAPRREKPSRAAYFPTDPPPLAPFPFSRESRHHDYDGDDCDPPFLCMMLKALVGFPGDDPPGTGAWGGGEYLLWWVRNAPVATSLVSTGNPADPFPGALGQPGTRVLLGDSGLNYGSFSGVRATLGSWFTPDQIWGIEGSGFILERRSTGQRFSSDAAGNPPLYLPLYQSNLSREDSYTLADSSQGLAGGVSVSSGIRLWGAEANAYRNLLRWGGHNLDLLLGFRYLDLDEELGLTGNRNNPGPDIRLTFHDRFSTRNQFYGGQVGGRFNCLLGRFFIDLLAKAALGNTHQVVNTDGDITVNGAGAANPGTFNGGVFTQPTNMGSQSGDRFTVVPAAQAKVGCFLTPRLRATAAYDFLYSNSVVRPGSQIDHNVNLSQQAGEALVGPATPVPLFNRSEFFTHGMSVGLELRY